MRLGDLGKLPGMHDIAGRLGFDAREVSLVVLEAADRWEAADSELPEPKMVLLRTGRVRLELGDGNAEILDEENVMWTDRQAVVGIVNLEPSIAEILVLAA